MANTLAYNDAATITAVKSFIVQPLGWKTKPLVYSTAKLIMIIKIWL